MNYKFSNKVNQESAPQSVAAEIGKSKQKAGFKASQLMQQVTSTASKISKVANDENNCYSFAIVIKTAATKANIRWSET